MSLHRASSRLLERGAFSGPEEETRSDLSTVVLPRESLAPIRRARPISGQARPEYAEQVREELLRGLAYETAAEAPDAAPSSRPGRYDPDSTPPLWPLKPRSLTLRKSQAQDDDDEVTPRSVRPVASTECAISPPWRFARPEIEDVTTAERDVGGIFPSRPRDGLNQSGVRRTGSEPTPAPKRSALATALVAGAFMTGAGFAVFICILLHVF